MSTLIQCDLSFTEHGDTQSPPSFLPLIIYLSILSQNSSINMRLNGKHKQEYQVMQSVKVAGQYSGYTQMKFWVISPREVLQLCPQSPV